MNGNALVYPMFAMVLVTATVLGILFRSRVRAVREARISSRYYRIFQGEVEPEQAAKAARHFSNLFEAPVLFYAACLAAMVTKDTGAPVQVLAWTYVLARIVHACIHLGGNRLGRRIKIYFVSWLILIALWSHVAVQAAS